MTVGYSDGRVYEDEMHAHLDIPAMPDNGDFQKQQPETDWSKPKKVYFVRHGDTDLNEDDKCRGWSSVGLNQDGRADAKKAAESLSGTPVEHLVASDLPRAQETGRIISRKLGIPIEYDPGLRTWDTGDFTGRPNSEVKADISRYTNETPDERPPGSSESFNEFKDRVLSAMSGIIQRHNDKEIGVVSHNMVGRVYHSYEEAGQPMKAMALWRKFAGDQPQQKAEAAVDPQAWPTEAQADLYRDNNMQYGDPNARFLQPGLASTKQIPGLSFNAIDRMSDPEEQMRMLKKYSEGKPIDADKADELTKAWIASRKSAVSQLGFDLEHSYTQRDKDPKLNVGGITGRLTNEIWSDHDPANPSAILHESMHRGMEKMRQAGVLPEPYKSSLDHEELMIRALMNKHHGPGSSPGPLGKEYLDKALKAIPEKDMDFVEAAAAGYLAKKRPGGPR